MSKLKIKLLLFVLIFSQVLISQNSEQIWLEYKPSYSFKKNYKLGMRASFRTNLQEPRWRTLELRFMPEKKLSKHFDVLTSLSFLETLQYHEFSTFEIRPAIGMRWHFLPERRVSSGVLLKLEFRNVLKQESDDWTYTTRPRLRVFGSMPITEKSMKPGKVLYATSFIEFFYQNEDDIQERYANRYWIRLGLGYKFNKKLQLELLYDRQDTKNTITATYDDLEIVNIFVCSLKHHLN